MLYIFLLNVHLIWWTTRVKVPGEYVPASAAFPHICRDRKLHPSEQLNILYNRHGDRERELPFTILLKRINRVLRWAASSKKAESRSMAQALWARR
jgi:hypothetical protein